MHFYVFIAVKKLESGLLKLYLITAYLAGKSDKVTEFFTKLAPELHLQSEWKEWFCMYSNSYSSECRFNLITPLFCSL